MLSAIVVALTIRQAVNADHSPNGMKRLQELTARTPSVPVMTMFDGDVLDSAASHIAAHDPFRIERKPANIPFSVAQNGGQGIPAPSAPPIRIALQGTIGGPPWSAIISGIPGHSGTVMVSSGDTLGGVAIRRVNKDSVTVRVKDSTWTVTQAKAGI
jgi:hypothetical protein